MNILPQSKQNRFSCLFAISFILNGYASGIPGVSLGSMLFLILIIWGINNLSSYKPKYTQLTILVVVVFFILSMLDYLLQGVSNSVAIFITWSKLLIWLAFATFMPLIFFNEDIIYKWLRKVGIVLSIYLIIQIIAFYVFGKYLPNIFSFGPLQPYDSGYADYERLSRGIFIRPASFLSESSFLGNYLMVTLSLAIKRLETYKEKLRIPLFFTLAIFLTSSTSAIVCTFLIWIIMVNKYLRKHAGICWLTGGALCLIMAISSFNFSSLNNSDNGFGYSIFYAFDKFNRIENNPRFGQSYDYLKALDENEEIIGVGIGNQDVVLDKIAYSDEDSYMNSLTQMLFDVGYIGTFIFFIWWLYLLLQNLKLKNLVGVSLLIVYLIKASGSGLLFNTYGVLFIFTIIGTLNTDDRKIKT